MNSAGFPIEARRHYKAHGRGIFSVATACDLKAAYINVRAASQELTKASNSDKTLGDIFKMTKMQIV